MDPQKLNPPHSASREARAHLTRRSYVPEPGVPLSGSATVVHSATPRTVEESQQRRRLEHAAAATAVPAVRRPIAIRAGAEVAATSGTAAATAADHRRNANEPDRVSAAAEAVLGAVGCGLRAATTPILRRERARPRARDPHFSPLPLL